MTHEHDEKDDGPGEWWDRVQPDEPEQLKRDRPLSAVIAMVVAVIAASGVALGLGYLLLFEFLPWLFEVFLGPADADPVSPVPSTIGP